MDSLRTISFSQVGFAPSTPKESREGKSARNLKESERDVSVSQNQPEEEGMVPNFDEYLGEWVSRITDLHHAVNTQERERYTTALRMGEREARLVLRRLKASEYREDKAHRELKRLSQLEATLIGEGRTRGGLGVGYTENKPHSSDGGSGFLGGSGLEGYILCIYIYIYILNISKQFSNKYINNTYIHI
jgi:hypothetical protein